MKVGTLGKERASASGRNSHSEVSVQPPANANSHKPNMDPIEKAKLLKDAKPPPFDIFTILLIGAFGAGVLYAVKYAIQRDGALSGDVRQRTLGEKKGVGPGKQNKSALGAQKRSAKKTN